MPKQPRSAQPLTYVSGMRASRSMTEPSRVAQYSRNCARNTGATLGLVRTGRGCGWIKIQPEPAQEQLLGERRFGPARLARLLGDRPGLRLTHVHGRSHDSPLLHTGLRAVPRTRRQLGHV